MPTSKRTNKTSGFSDVPGLAVGALKRGEMSSRQEDIDYREMADIYRTFCPPLVNRRCRKLQVIDPDIVKFVSDFSQQQAKQMGVPAWLSKKVLYPDAMTISKVRGQKAGGTSYFLPRYLDSREIKNLLTEMEEDPHMDISVMSTLESSGEKVVLRSPEGHDAVIAPKRATFFNQGLLQLGKDLRRAEKKTAGSFASRKVHYPPTYKAHSTTDTSVIPPSADPRYSNLPFGLVQESLKEPPRVYTRTRKKALQGHLFEANANFNSAIRFALPEHLGNLSGLNVLQYIQQFCSVKSDLRDVLIHRYQNTSNWERKAPFDMVKEHARTALLGMINEDELDDFMGYFKFSDGFTLNRQVYVKIMALIFRIYGSRLAEVDKDFWRFCAAPLEYVDFRGLLDRLLDVELTPNLRKLLVKLTQIAVEFHLT
ncbi:unnamed protein product [Mesocestoides corti]|uniref:ARID domain-containing protein n=1 Tax=Mesocestoides corti TaxID=53468 RepID=A0A0R3UEJ8_MESCO|nr:unnamed protein product [Mesocestoides corti]